MARTAEAETYVPQLLDCKISAMEAQFVSEIVKGVDEYFMRRHTNCM